MEKNKFSVSEYALECWRGEFGGDPVREVASADWSECYEIDACHVFELQNGKFALVSERGCSCYDYSGASISIFETEAEAMKEYAKEVPDAQQATESKDG